MNLRAYFKIKIIGIFLLSHEFQHEKRGPLEDGERGKEKSGKRAILSERSFAERVQL
jgi:hypothetical protein